MLSEAERIQLKRFHFEDDRRRYLITRALLRTVLSKNVTDDIAPREWTFAVGAYGRPYITNRHPALRGVSFNISHTKGLVIVALCHDQTLGVDTEAVVNANSYFDIVDRYLTSTEITSLKALSEAERSQRFFEYWTLKEAYIKARGMGLAIPLNDFSFDFSDLTSVELTIYSRQSDTPERWRFWQFLLRERYLVAVCAQRFRGWIPEVFMFNTVPLVSQHTLVWSLLRKTRS